MRYMLIVPVLLLTACGGVEGNTANSTGPGQNRQPASREEVTPPKVSEADKVRAAELSMQAAQKIFENDNTGALELVEQAVKLHPDKPEYHDQLGYVHEQLGRYDDALRHYLEAASLFDRRAKAASQEEARKNEQRVTLRAANCVYLLARKERAAGELDAALDHALLAVKLGPSAARFQVELGHVYGARGEKAESINAYDFAADLSVGEEHHEALHWKAQAQYGAELYRHAIETFTQLIDLDVEGYEAYGMRGYCFTQVGEKDKAISDFTQAVQRTTDKAKKAEYEDVLRQLTQLEDGE